MRRFERRHVGAIPAGGTFPTRSSNRPEQRTPNLTRGLQVRFLSGRPFYYRIVQSRTTDFEPVKSWCESKSGSHFAAEALIATHPVGIGKRPVQIWTVAPLSKGRVC